MLFSFSAATWHFRRADSSSSCIQCKASEGRDAARFREAIVVLCCSSFRRSPLAPLREAINHLCCSVFPVFRERNPVFVGHRFLFHRKQRRTPKSLLKEFRRSSHLPGRASISSTHLVRRAVPFAPPFLGKEN